MSDMGRLLTGRRALPGGGLAQPSPGPAPTPHGARLGRPAGDSLRSGAGDSLRSGAFSGPPLRRARGEAALSGTMREDSQVINVAGDFGVRGLK